MNNILKERVSLILATETNEEGGNKFSGYYGFIKFSFFIKLLAVIARQHWIGITISPVIIIDISSNHSSLITINLIKDLDLEVDFWHRTNWKLHLMNKYLEW